MAITSHQANSVFLWTCRCSSPSKTVARLFLIHQLPSLPDEKCDMYNISWKSLRYNSLVHRLDEQHSTWWQMHYFDIGMKVIPEWGWPGSLSNSKRMLNRMFYSKQYFSTCKIKWWKNQSWKMTCVTRGLGLLFHTTGREPMALFLRALGFSEWWTKRGFNVSSFLM